MPIQFGDMTDFGHCMSHQFGMIPILSRGIGRYAISGPIRVRVFDGPGYGLTLTRVLSDSICIPGRHSSPSPDTGENTHLGCDTSVEQDL